MPNQVNTNSLQSTQAGGADQVDLYPSSTDRALFNFLVQAEVVLTADGTGATATAGTLDVLGKGMGAATFQLLGTINLAAPEPRTFVGYYSELKAVSTGFDADKTWKLTIVNGA